MNVNITSIFGHFSGQSRISSVLSTFQSKRTLFSKEYLGIEGYKRRRQYIDRQFDAQSKADIKDRLQKYVSQSNEEKSPIQIRLDDILNFVHFVENNPEDLTLLRELFYRRNAWQSNDGSPQEQQYTFGPVILRALNLFKADETAFTVNNFLLISFGMDSYI